MGVLAKVLIYGDPHLSSKPYGMHTNYPEESLEYFSKITKVAEDEGVTHIIGTGDLTYGRFHTLEYRDRVEAELKKQFELTNGNRYEVKGNHDSATNGMTEYEFYVRKGLIKSSENINIGNVHFTMIDNGRIRSAETNIVDSETDVNVIVAHDYLKFKNTELPNFGSAIELDEMSKFYGVDFIICGHIHKIMAFKGRIYKEGIGKEVTVYYPGCMARPAYGNNLDKVGNIALFTIFDDGKVKYDIKEIELWPLEKAFLTEAIEQREEEKERKEERVDISNMVKQLDSHDTTIGNPEDIIMAMHGIDEKYKLKAVQLLKEA